MRASIDWIWRIRGSLALASGQSDEEAFHRLSGLFRQKGTKHELVGDTLVFEKKDQAAQDRMSIFDRGQLRIEQGLGGAVLRYDLVSRALLFCFLAPALFLALGQLTILVGKLDTAPVKAEKSKEKEKEKAPAAMNPIDIALGAPAPEKPKDDKAKKKKDEDKKNSPTSAYVFAAIFAALYVVGRLLEDRLIRRLFRKALAEPVPA